MRAFYLGWQISPTVSAKFEARVKGSPFSEAAIDKSPVAPTDFVAIAGAFFVVVVAVRTTLIRRKFECKGLL
jgi:hypothetical protein